MSKEIAHKKIRDEVILGYRKVILERYDYARLKDRADLPHSFDEERIETFKNYFLNYLYPPPAKRMELDEAFDSLDNYIKHPDKLLRLVIDSGSLLFKYGRHLPKILNAGIKALRSFRNATQFEERLVNQAVLQKLEMPYGVSEIETLIRTLPREELEKFIDSSRSLFEILHDRTLVLKIKDIVGHLIQKMKKRPTTYTPAEIRGMEIGEAIIAQGDLLFDQLSKADQQLIFQLVIKMEREILERIFSE